MKPAVIDETKSFVVEELHTERTEEGYVRPESSMELPSKPSVEMVDSPSKLQDLR